MIFFKKFVKQIKTIIFMEGLIMFGNTFGKLFKVTTCGESYGGGFRKNLNIPKELFGGLVTIVDGVPPGIKLTADMIQVELDKRKPGQSKLDSPFSKNKWRKELCYVYRLVKCHISFLLFAC